MPAIPCPDIENNATHDLIGIRDFELSIQLVEDSNTRLTRSLEVVPAGPACVLV